jgi:hypothetical protein
VELEMPEIPETLDREQVILELVALAAAGALWQRIFAAAVLLIITTEETVAVAVLVALAQTQEAMVVSILTPVRPP